MITSDDIMYKDLLVSILHPHVKKGILVYTHYNQPTRVQLDEQDSIPNTGLKTGKILNEEGIDFGRSIYHPYIFFRAPYYSKKIDYTSLETEIISSYGEEVMTYKNSIFIRVDPNETYVFSSEIRAKKPENIEFSKKSLSEYLEIIEENSEIYPFIYPIYKTGYKPSYNLYSSRLIPISWSYKIKYPFDKSPINRNSEILVSIPHLTPEYFVYCI